ncbi:MAG: hypothetical protein NVSMB9_35450 [Isosphaeraceae bacterium]
MPLATCRCGQKLSLPSNGPDRVICPKCSARVRVRRDALKVSSGDGFIRFDCPCGRRLKVRAESASGLGSTPRTGQCPDCGTVVPVPSASSSGLTKPKDNLETPTDELSAEDLVALDQWSQGRLALAQARSPTAAAAVVDPRAEPASPPGSTPVPPPSSLKSEAGLRICPRCGRPIHLGADTCRECGVLVPKR